MVAALLTPGDCMSIGDTEIIRSSYGFYGLPNYRYLNKKDRWFKLLTLLLSGPMGLPMEGMALLDMDT